MMLSSAGQAGDAARCREVGVATYLTKPIRQSHLLDAIMIALGTRATATAEGASRDAGAKPLSSTTSGHGRRILLAEDNEVNQKLAVRLLEKRGYAVTVASNGREALAALDRERFDLVLMDVQMPEMGGFEATAAIRAREQGSSSHLPIVAMTAHAMKGDRERCLEEGMDGYVTKPIQPQILFDAIEALLPAAPVGEPDPIAAARPGAPPSIDAEAGTELIDRAQVLRRVGGDLDLLKELTEIFLEECPQLLTSVREAIAGRDGEALERAAHKIKGAVSNFSAHAAVEAALQLETMGREGDLTGAESVCVALESSIERLKPALAALGTE